MDYPESINTDDLESTETVTHKPDFWADGLFLPVQTQSLNTVFSAMVLEHICEPDLFIKEVSRILKKDGKLIMSTVQSFPIHHDKYDFFRYTKHGLRYLLEKNGIELIEIRQNGKYYAHIGEMKNHFWNFRFFRNINNKYMKIAGGLLKVVLTPVLLLMTLFRNLFCLLLSSIDREENITTSYILLGRKK